MRFFLLAAAAAVLLAQSAAGLKWTAPPTWKSAGERPMRAATYNIAAASGDSDPAECAVYFFGQGQGGPVEANLERWKNQFKGPGGKPAEAHVAKKKINGLQVTTIETSGDYSGMGGPMAPQGGVKGGYRMLAAVIEGPGGNLFLKFTGPAKTVAANQKAYEGLLNSFKQ